MNQRQLPKIDMIPAGTPVFLDETGEELTVELTEEFVEAARQVRRGRPSVTGGSVHTPTLTVRIPEPLRDQLDTLASRKGVRRSDLIREVLTDYVRNAS